MKDTILDQQWQVATDVPDKPVEEVANSVGDEVTSKAEATIVKEPTKGKALTENESKLAKLVDDLTGQILQAERKNNLTPETLRSLLLIFSSKLRKEKIIKSKESWKALARPENEHTVREQKVAERIAQLLVPSSTKK